MKGTAMKAQLNGYKVKLNGYKAKLNGYKAQLHNKRKMMGAALVGLSLAFFAAPIQAGVITDMAGRKVVLPEKIERVIALQGALSVLCCLDCTDRVVGVENEELSSTHWIGEKGRTYSMANPGLAGLPAVGSRQSPLPEKIISLKPQVLFTGGGADSADQLQRQTGIPVVVLPPGELGAGEMRFYQTLRLAGRICGKTEQANRCISRIEKEKAELAARIAQIPQGERKRAYVGGLQFRVGHGLMGTSRAYPPFQMAGAINVVDALPVARTLIKGRFTLEREVFLTLSPDVIFVSESGLDAVVGELASPVYRDIPAIREGRVYGLLPHYYSADPATVLAEAWYVGKVLYPEAFRDIEIAKKADELYTFFHGRPLYAEMEANFGGFKPLAEIRWKR